MKKLIFTVMLLIAMTACSVSTASTTAPVSQVNQTQSTATSVPTATSASDPVMDTSIETSGLHADPQDTVWDSSEEVPIELSDSGITTTEKGVSIDGSLVTITSAGTYRLNGSLTDGQIIVDTRDKEVVRIILNGVELTNSSGAAISIVNAEKTVIILAENSKNVISDGANYVFDDPTTDEPNAAIFSKSDLTIFGSGSLTVNGNYNDGISSKDGLIITSGTITVNAVDDGIRGKDYLVVQEGAITINAGGDGLKSDNAEDATKGFISIENGTLDITSSGDAIQAQTDVLVSNGVFNLTTGGGSNGVIDGTTSIKGIDAKVNLVINGGSFTINSADDAIHSNTNLVINNGSYLIATGDDGMHADATLEINGGDIQITQSYEGIESAVITINDGNIHIVASDDGINVAGGNDGSGMNPGMRPGGQPRPGGAPGQDNFNYTGNDCLYIHGGTIVVTDADGDGIDVNGAIEMTDGLVIVNGPTAQNNGAIDYDASFKMMGGFIVAAGSSGMAQVPGAASSQASLLVYFNSTLPANTLVHIQNSTGEDILTFAPTKPFQSIAFSSPELVNGESYVVYTGGSDNGTQTDGLYQDGTYKDGTQFASFTVSSMVTTIGTGGGFGGGGGRQRP